MYLYKIFFISLVFFLLYFLTTSHTQLPDNFGMLPPKSHILDILVDQRIQELSSKDYKFMTSNVTQYADGRFFTPYTVFVSSPLQRVDIDRAEDDFSYTFEKVMQTYNNIPEVRPYLDRFPLNTEDLDVWIQYQSSPQVYQPLPYICLIRIPYHNGRTLEFRKWTKSPECDVTNLPVFASKSLQDVPILNTYANAGVPRQTSTIKNPIILDKECKNGVYLRRATFIYPLLINICEKYSFHISTLSHAGIGAGFNKYKEIAVGFWAQNKRMKLEEAQDFTRIFIEEFLHEIRTQKLVEQNHRRNFEVFKDLKENLNWFCFRITFWDEYLNRIEEPYIAHIQCQDGKILYFTADEGQRLQQVLEEDVPERFFPKKPISS